MVVESEVAILRRTNHANIVRLYRDFDFPDKLCLVMEYVPVSHRTMFRCQSRSHGKEVVVEREVAILRRTNHANNVRLYRDFDFPDKLCLVMEYVPVSHRTMFRCQSRYHGKEVVVEREVAILRRTNHANIVRLYRDFDFPDKLCLVMEYVPVSHRTMFRCQSRYHGKEVVVEREVAILRRTNHANIVRLYRDFDFPDKLCLLAQVCSIVYVGENELTV